MVQRGLASGNERSMGQTEGREAGFLRQECAGRSEARGAVSQHSRQATPDPTFQPHSAPHFLREHLRIPQESQPVTVRCYLMAPLPPAPQPYPRLALTFQVRGWETTSKTV